MENQTASLVNDQLIAQLRLLVKQGIIPQPQPLKKMVRARVISFDDDGASNGACSQIVLCLEGQAHLTVRHSWFENGDHDEINYSVMVTNCNCQSYNDLLIAADHAELVAKFLQTGEVQKLEQTTEPAIFPNDYLRLMNSRNRQQQGD